MTMTSITKPIQDGRITALKNEHDTLSLLHRFGWLRSRDLADLIWNDSKSTSSAIAMAQRTIKRLKESGQLLHRMAPDGATVYSLAEAGARRLGDECGIAAKSGKDLIRELGNYTHRCNANSFAIYRLNSGQKIWTEREIQSGKAPIKAINHKVPDGLVDITDGLYAEGTLVLAWVEVEAGYKKNTDFYKMLRFAFNILGPLDSQDMPVNTLFCAADDVYIGEVFIQIVDEAQLNRIVNAVRAEKLNDPYGYAWGKIEAQLFLAGLAGKSYPISIWLPD